MAWQSLLFVIVFLLALHFSHSQSQPPNKFIYTGFSGLANTTNVTLVRTAVIQPDGILRLTNETSRLIGRAFYPNPYRFTNSSSFSTSFAFAVVPEYPKLGGHGLAFTIAPSPFLPGAQPSQYLGLMNSTTNGSAADHVLAVEFDTVQDFEFQDPNDNHVGVDLNSMQSSAVFNASYYLSDGSTIAPITLKGGGAIVAWIEFDASSSLLNVTIAPISDASRKPPRPIISLKVDLPAIVGDTAYVGFSAATGLLASSHYLFGWSFAMDGPADSLDLSRLPMLPKTKSTASEIRALAIGTSIASGVLLVVAVAAGIVVYKKLREDDVVEPWELEYGPHRFPYRELAHATKGFGDKELLGFGGFGQVYRGVLPGTKTEVAVKRIAHGSKQGLREFVAEVSSIGRLRHRNLVQLQGWCRRRSDLLLVYEYMPNGSLDKHLFDQTGPNPCLDWAQRYRILRGVASALLYLHEEWEQVVLHRDVKASNVLLDADMNGRLGDFGLARLYEHGSNPSTTRVVGTLGYLAPELTRTGKATIKSDVYAFGALLLEVAGGRRPIEPKSPPEELVLVEWVWACCCSGQILDVMDPSLQGEFNPAEAELVLKLGLLCSHPDQAMRPTMRQVMQYLDGDATLPDIATDGPRPAAALGGRSGFFDDYIHSYPSSVDLVSSGSVPSARRPAPGSNSPVSLLDPYDQPLNNNSV